MNIASDINAASGGVYQIRSRNEAAETRPDAAALRAQPSPTTANTDAINLSSAAKALAAATGLDRALTNAASSLAGNNKPAQPADALNATPQGGNTPLQESQGQAAPLAFNQGDLDSLLSVFGQSYDLADIENADPMAVQYDLNADGVVDALDLSTLLGAFSTES